MPVEQTFTGRSTCSDGEISTRPPLSLTLLTCPSGPKLLTPCAVTSVSRSLSIPAVKSHPVTQRLPPHNLTERTPASGLPNRCAVIETDCSRRKGRSSTCGALVTSLAHKAKSGSPSASSAAREGLPPTSRTRLAPRLAYQSSSLAVVTATPTERNARPNPSPRLGSRHTEILSPAARSPAATTRATSTSLASAQPLTCVEAGRYLKMLRSFSSPPTSIERPNHSSHSRASRV